MARILRMPSEKDLPPGTRRDFAEALFTLHKAADRPTLREISREIEGSESPTTVSVETIRLMLLGARVPSRWVVVQAVVWGLCSLAKLDPNFPFYSDDADGPSREEYIHSRWDAALDQPDLFYRRASRRSEDPWDSPDEPPF